MASISLSSLSNEYIRVQVEATESGAVVDPTAFAVSFAFETDETEPTSFNLGNWETDPGPPIKYLARILVGSAGVVLTDDTYFVWLKIAGSPEIPVRRVGNLIIE